MKGQESKNENIAALIQECEDYVKTEEFTKDLSSQILKMFMQERLVQNSSSLQNVTNSNPIESKNSLRDSVYDNEHEESPDSNDSAYDSYKKSNKNHHSRRLVNYDFYDDNLSNASTIKNQLRDKDDISISYDTAMR